MTATEEIKTGLISSAEQLDELIDRVVAAQKEFSTFSK